MKVIFILLSTVLALSLRGYNPMGWVDCEHNCLLADDSQGEDDRLIGGAVQRRPTQAVPDDPFRVTGVRKEERYPPFTKHLSSCGIALAATDQVPDEFLVLVGQTIDEMFARRDELDLVAQRKVVEHLHAYGTLLPVPLSERSFERLLRRHEDRLDDLHQEYSICDIIMAKVPTGQVMEVVEHLLHAVTDVGLHYQFPAEWGLSRDSDLWKAMQLAIEKGYYNIDSYDDLRGEPRAIVDRILLQEFAYWFISTAWDLQTPYGPGEEEWTLRTPDDLQEKMPEFYQVYQRTAARVMTAPTKKTLAKIGPTRARERRGRR